MTVTAQKQVLITARALIADPEHWTRSVQWCAMGAIYRAAYDLVGDANEATRIGKEVAQSVALFWFCRDLTTMNDMWGHAAVLKRFDRALAAA